MLMCSYKIKKCVKFQIRYQTADPANTHQISTETTVQYSVQRPVHSAQTNSSEQYSDMEEQKDVEVTEVRTSAPQEPEYHAVPK